MFADWVGSVPLTDELRVKHSLGPNVKGVIVLVVYPAIGG